MGLRSPDWLYNELYSIFSSIRESSIKHLHLIFPLFTQDFTYQKIHIQVCEELDIPYINIGNIEFNIQLIPDCPFFLDTTHVNYNYAKQLAYVIYKNRQKIPHNPKQKLRISPKKSKEYSNVNLLENFPHASTVIRTTSLKTEKFIELKDNEEITLKNLPKLNLESIFYWSNTETGFYSLTTEGITQNYSLSNTFNKLYTFSPYSTEYISY